MPTPVYLIATPIGDYMQDMSVAALHALKTLRHLFLEADDGFAARLREQGLVGDQHRIYYLDEPQVERAKELIAAAEPFGVLASSGIPGFLDPGREIVDLCLDQHLSEVELVPLGVSSALDAALCMCGVDLDLFHFNGHYPERYVFESLADTPELSVVYFVRGGSIQAFLREADEQISGVRRVLCFKDVRKKQRARTFVVRPTDLQQGELPADEADADYVCVVDRTLPR